MATSSVTCRFCGVMIGADDEDELVALVQSHARDHGHTRDLTREHILARLHGQGPKND